MSRLTPTISIFLLFFVILGGYFFWWPEYQNFKELKLALEKKKLEIEQAEEYLSKLKVLSNRLTEYPVELAKIDSALPFESSMPALFNFIQKTSSENGLVLKEMNLRKIASGKISKTRIQKIPFLITVSGSYSAFKDLLSVIYKNSRIIEVNFVKFSSEEETSFFTFNLVLETNSYQK